MKARSRKATATRGGRGRAIQNTSRAAVEAPGNVKNRQRQVDEAAEVVFAALRDIAQAMVDKAIQGSYLHAKCAIEMARVAEVELPKHSEPEPWVVELLSALKALPEDGQPASSV